jgi:hypothetical protein
MKPASALAEHLGYGDRREVARAVRYGRAVDDPELVYAAIVHARYVQALAKRWTRRTPDGWRSLLGAFARDEGWMILIPMLLLLPWIRDPVPIALEGFMVVVLGHLLVRYAKHAPALAAQAELANCRLVGEAVETVEPAPPAEERPPWWRPRVFVRRSKLDAPGWVPIPFRQLVPFWMAYAGVAISIGLTAPGSVQDWLPLVYLTVLIEVERRLAEPVERRLGLAEAQRVRGYDVHRSGRGWRWTILSVVQFAAVGAMSVGIVASGWFRGHGLGVAFGLVILLTFVYRDLASRWRLHDAVRRSA